MQGNCGCSCHHPTLGLMTAHVAPCCYPTALADGYEGVTHAGIALVATESERVLLVQRAPDPTDASDVAETWEFPGGGLNPGEDPQAGAFREFTEETGLQMPADATVVDGWCSDDGVYQGFVVTTAAGFTESGWNPTDEVQAIAWVVREDLPKYTLRPEVEMQTDWSLIFGPVSGNEDNMTTPATETEPDWDIAAALAAPIPIHGVLAPEDVPTGDGRGFNAGSMTRRPLRLPFRHQKYDIGGHDGAYVLGSVDRLMRLDGMILWEGSLMPCAETEEFIDLLAFFGQFGVSVDGTDGALDRAKSQASGIMWFEAVKAAGLTACAIPAFHQAYVAFGNHPLMPEGSDEGALTASGVDRTDMVGARADFGRGPGWVTNPEDTRRIHDYWTKKGEEGYEKVGWGTPGDFARAKALIGAKIAANSPDKMRFINQIIAQWHFDALGYWPTTHAKMDRAGAEAASGEVLTAAMTAAVERITNEDIKPAGFGEGLFEAVVTASGSGSKKYPPLEYFHQPAEMVEDPFSVEGGALVIEEPDEFGFERVWGFAGEWGVCHIGIDGRCVEPPRTYSDDYPDFHLGYTRTKEGTVYTGVLTYGVGHRDAKTILAETPDQAFFDNVNNAWASVRVGENERGIWFSGVRLAHVPDEHITLIEASGQVSGEWKYGEMRACLTVNVPGYAVHRASAEYDDQGNVLALAASAFRSTEGVNEVEESECSDAETPAKIMAALAQADAEATMERLRREWA